MSATRSPARAHNPVYAQGKSAVEISAKLSKDVAKIVAESVGEALKNVSNTQVGHGCCVPRSKVAVQTFAITTIDHALATDAG